MYIVKGGGSANPFSAQAQPPRPCSCAKLASAISPYCFHHRPSESHVKSTTKTSASFYLESSSLRKNGLNLQSLPIHVFLLTSRSSRTTVPILKVFLLQNCPERAWRGGAGRGGRATCPALFKLRCRTFLLCPVLLVI